LKGLYDMKGLIREGLHNYKRFKQRKVHDMKAVTRERTYPYQIFIKERIPCFILYMKGLHFIQGIKQHKTLQDERGLTEKVSDVKPTVHYNYGLKKNNLNI
jgi:hypothetical protein